MEYDSLMVKNVSYLRARDPSILSYNQTKLSKIKTNLLEEFAEITQQQRQEKQDQSEHIRVYLRIKNGSEFGDLYKIEGSNTLLCTIPPGSNFLRNFREGDSMKRRYTFSEIFEPPTTQKDIFNHVVKPKILDFINGEHSTLMTYGASGSGKTFTLIGTDEEPGIVPRSLEYLFRTLPQLSKHPKFKPTPSGEVTVLNTPDSKKEIMLCRSFLNASTTSVDRTQHIKTYRAMQQRLSGEPAAELDDLTGISVYVWVSFAEIYNEQIYDLLELEPPRGKQRNRLRLGMSNGSTYIKNLTNINVTSGQEAYEILQCGIHNLNYAATQLNKHSSRSHSIFTIKLVQVSCLDGGSHMSCFSFCDLAGSERCKKTHNVGERLIESKNINNSLLVLGRCVSAIRNGEKLVPFRESKLTQLFQKALASDLAMIVTISPTRDMFDESQHVLNFSALAQDVQIEQKREKKKNNRFSQLVEGKNYEFIECSEQYYKDIIADLELKLEQQAAEFDSTHKMNMDYIREGYDKCIQNLEDEIPKRVKREVNLVKIIYENKLANVTRRYEALLNEAQQKNGVIEIDSSSDEDENKENIKIENQEQNNKQFAQNLELKQQILNLKNEIQNLTDANDKTVRHFEETLRDGVTDYKELERENEILEEENLKLREENSNLKIELDSVRQQMVVLISEDFSSETDQEQEEEHTI